MRIFDSLKKKLKESKEIETVRRTKDAITTSTEKTKTEITSSHTGKIEVGNRIGRKFEIYRIFGGEGKSGMGIVYVCYNHEQRAVLALKTFQDKYLSSGEIKDSFKREALAWVHLERHPYIVQAISVEELDNRLFIILEYIAPDEAGRNTLTHYLQSPISLRLTLEWAIQFCYGMEHATSRGVTPHRDIKPDNIMITRDGTVKITDFGLAKLWDQTETIADWKELAEEGRSGLRFLRVADGKAVVGTFPWMAPEQFEGKADIRSDIYSFGIVLYQMANWGRLPFSARTVEDYYRAHKSTPVPRLDTKLLPVIERCLQKSPEARYRDFQELRIHLEKVYLAEIGATPPSPPRMIELEAEEYSNKGLSFYTLGLLDDAIRECRKALQIKPDFAYAHNTLGIILKAKGLLDDAIREFRKALLIKPDYATAYYNLGNAFSAKGLLNDAIREFEETLQLKPDFAEAHHNLGYLLAAKGLLDDAIKEFREALRLRPNFAEAHNNLGNALYVKELLDDAIKEYREALRVKPDYALAYNNLGKALQDKEIFDEAIEAYQNFIKYAPTQYAQHIEQVRQRIREMEGEKR